jgi:NAD(P)H-dependent flavin oxidoreductase YrpB (nitropropane dioxygenase family)
MKHACLTDKMSIPLIQGGMGVGISMGRLAGSVAAEGGMGVISTASIGFREHDFWTDPKEANVRALRGEIDKARQISGGRGLVAVNAMVATRQFDQMVRTAIQAGVDCVIAGAGLPLNLPELAGSADVLLAPVVSSGRAASLLMKKWKHSYGRMPDLFVVEGSKAGGHLGFSEDALNNGKTLSLQELVREVSVAAGGIPVFAAGGINDRQDVKAIKDAGATGIQVATRFIATEECDASQGFKDVILRADNKDAIIVKSPVGMPGRAVRSPLLERTSRGCGQEAEVCVGCIRGCEPKKISYCINRALIAAWHGDWEHGLFFCGADVGKVIRMSNVRAVIRELLEREAG